MNWFFLDKAKKLAERDVKYCKMIQLECFEIFKIQFVLEVKQFSHQKIKGDSSNYVIFIYK